MVGEGRDHNHYKLVLIDLADRRKVRDPTAKNMVNVLNILEMDCESG